MDKYIEHALAKQVYELIGISRLKSSYDIYMQTKDGIEKNDTTTCIDLIKHIMNSGVSPLAVVEHGNDIKPLISHVFSSTQNDAILNIFIDVLKKDHIDNLDQKTILRLYNNLAVNEYSNVSEIFLKKIFELGFDFKQGTFNEVRKAMEGNQLFFELCMIHKPDFKFDFKYNDGLYLDEIAKKNLEFEDKSDSSYKKKENLLIFLEKSRKVHELKTSLDSELTLKSRNKNKAKI